MRDCRLKKEEGQGLRHKALQYLKLRVGEYSSKGDRREIRRLHNHRSHEQKVSEDKGSQPH